MTKAEMAVELQRRLWNITDGDYYNKIRSNRAKLRAAKAYGANLAQAVRAMGCPQAKYKVRLAGHNALITITAQLHAPTDGWDINFSI